MPPCVYCHTRPVDPAWRPFCSERCQLLDLANWVDGRYSVPSEEPEPAETDNPSPAGQAPRTGPPKGDTTEP
ncbi:MAG: DNA gyrase inhibitor YacG [Acidobacteria bacterium]|nr:DNA gyrase inhibitor YacG [Acidobacteriota bacterium]MBI3265043.1 DNA gyrase inhibitor YacG [Acidobacteriota bacterium]